MNTLLERVTTLAGADFYITNVRLNEAGSGSIELKVTKAESLGQWIEFEFSENVLVSLNTIGIVSADSFIRAAELVRSLK